MDGKEIKVFRKKWGLSQQKVAEDMGISKSKISEYESGKRPIPIYFEKHFRLYANLSTFTAKRIWDNEMADCFPEAYTRITDAETRQEIEMAVGKLLLCGMKGRRWRRFADLARSVNEYRKILRFAACRVEEIEKVIAW